MAQALKPDDDAPGVPAVLQGDTIGFANWRFVWLGSFTWKRADPDQKTDFGAYFDQVEVPYGVRLFVRQPDQIGPVSLATPGLNVSGACLNTVLHDQGVYRGWGYALADGEDLSELRYFESGNGLDWSPRPISGQYRIDLPKRGLLRGHVFKTADPGDPMPYKHVEEGVMPVEQAKAMIEAHADRVDPKSFRADIGKIYGLFGAQSVDGLAWQALDRPIALQHSDTQTIGFYDVERRRYVLYTRTWDTPATTVENALAKPTSWIAYGRRSIGMTESPTFGDFPLSHAVLTPDAAMKPSEQLYYNCRTALPGAPDQHVMFPGFYDLATDVIEAHVATSPDGSAWSIAPGNALIAARPDQA